MWGGQAKEREGSPLGGGGQPCVFSVIYGGAILCSFTMPQASEMRGWASTAQRRRNKKKNVWKRDCTKASGTLVSQAHLKDYCGLTGCEIIHNILERSCKLQCQAGNQTGNMLALVAGCSVQDLPPSSLSCWSKNVQLWHKTKCLI